MIGSWKCADIFGRRHTKGVAGSAVDPQEERRSQPPDKVLAGFGMYQGCDLDLRTQNATAMSSDPDHVMLSPQVPLPAYHASGPCCGSPERSVPLPCVSDARADNTRTVSTAAENLTNGAIEDLTPGRGGDEPQVVGASRRLRFRLG